MNTQKQIFEKLAKQQIEKQNLGAIEDAVNEVQNNISTQVTNIETLLYSLNTETEGIVDGIFGFSMQARDMVTRVQSLYDEYEAEYLRLSQELDSLGLSYEGLDTSIKSDFKDAINYANMLGNIEV